MCSASCSGRWCSRVRVSARGARRSGGRTGPRSFSVAPTAPAESQSATAEARPAAAQERENGGLPAIEAHTAGFDRFDGFFPLYWDDSTGTLWLEIGRLGEEANDFVAVKSTKCRSEAVLAQIEWGYLHEDPAFK